MSTTLLKPTGPKNEQRFPRSAERRRSDREAYTMEAWISPPNSTEPGDRHEAESINLSRHGVAFRISRPLAADAAFVVEIGVGSQRLVSEVRVVSCHRVGDRQFEIGAEFC